MFSLGVTCYAMSSWYPWEACSCLKGNERAVGLGERHEEEELGGVKGGETVFDMYYM